jgi:hypothetical protein
MYNIIKYYFIYILFPGQNAAMIFDSSNPTGGDWDLGTPNEMFGGPALF